MNNVYTIDKDQAERIKQELRAVGVSKFALHKFTTHYLPRVIHPGEHIEAAVFGRHKETEGLFGAIEGALVATDRRVIFINHQPGYTTMDELGYDKVSGVNLSRAGLYSSLTLFTKIANYTLSFASPKCAKKLAEYIESRVASSGKPHAPTTEYEVPISDEVQAFLRTHELGVLSSLERTGSVSGAAIYYTLYDNRPYFMTKTGTRKASNIVGNRHVALTVVDESKLQTVQMQGIVEAETDGLIKAEILNRLIRSRQYEKKDSLPPIMKLDGEFVIFRIRPTKFSYADYSKR